MKGDILPSEIQEQIDPVTGARVTRLTNYRAHSYPLYFTHNGFYDGGRRLVIGSDRGPAPAFYSVELATGQLTQLSDSALGTVDGGCLNPTRPEVFLWRARQLVTLDLATLEERVLCQAPEGLLPGSCSCTADGQWVCAALCSPTKRAAQAYSGFREAFLSRPRCQIIRVPAAGGEPELLHEEQYWLGHVNTSPVHPHLLTFCHEGPWLEVDQRIWGMDLRSGRVWAIRQQPWPRPVDPHAGTGVGHEYWMADGATLGYHGVANGRLIWGAIRYDNTASSEFPVTHDSRHFYSADRSLVVGDGRSDFPYLLLWRPTAAGMGEPRVLCWHRSSAHVHKTHVHPRFTPDGRAVLFTSDESGYGNVHLAHLPADLDTLPALSEVLHGPRKPWVPFEWMKELGKADFSTETQRHGGGQMQK